MNLVQLAETMEQVARVHLERSPDQAFRMDGTINWGYIELQMFRDPRVHADVIDLDGATWYRLIHSFAPQLEEEYAK